MNVPLSRPDITEWEVEYVTQRAPGQLSLRARALKFDWQGRRILSSFTSSGEMAGSSSKQILNGRN